MKLLGFKVLRFWGLGFKALEFKVLMCSASSFKPHLVLFRWLPIKENESRVRRANREQEGGEKRTSRRVSHRERGGESRTRKGEGGLASGE